MYIGFKNVFVFVHTLLFDNNEVADVIKLLLTYKLPLTDTLPKKFDPEGLLDDMS
jgi:hypothetical protein